MKVVYARCAGLDVHKKSVHVCIRVMKGKKVESEAAVFATFTEDLENLRDYLRKHKIRRVVMESTGVYWIPVWNVLERAEWKFDLVLVNPQHVRALPGRKTDQQDCERLAELGQYNLLRASFIPPRDIRELRDLTRRRAHLHEDRNRMINRIQRLIETANIKLSSVVSNVVGKTGWLILNAIANGHTEATELTDFAQGTLKRKTRELNAAVQGHVTQHFRWLLKEALADLSRLDQQLHDVEARIRHRMQPYTDVLVRLCTIPGVQEVTAWTLIAELGTDMSQFQDARHAASWAGLCPGNCESGGKRQSGRTRKGDRYLRRALVQSAWAVAHKENCVLTAVFHRVKARRGPKRAAMAVAHRILVIAYSILRDGGVYREYGGDYFDRLQPERTARRLVKRLTAMGYDVRIESSDAAAPRGSDAPSQKKETRGRPPRTSAAPFGTLKWTSADQLQSKPVRGKRTGTEQQPATGDVCAKCAQWGIACIHVRHQIRSIPSDGSPG